MNQVKDFAKYPFVMEAKTKSFQKRKIYRYSTNKELFYLVTPMSFDESESKVKTIDEISSLIRDGKMIQYTKSNNIFEKINKAWENWSDEWIHEGKHFSVTSISDIRDAPWHHGPMAAMKIGYYHGELVWVTGFHYMPRVCYCKFNSIYEKPSWEYVGYTNIRNIKPVYCEETNSYI